MPSFDDVYKCLRKNGPAHVKGAKGGDYTVHAKEINGVRTIDAVLGNGGHVRIHEDCWEENNTCQGTWAGGIYNNPPYSIYDWFSKSCGGSKETD